MIAPRSDVGSGCKPEAKPAFKPMGSLRHVGREKNSPGSIRQHRLQRWPPKPRNRVRLLGWVLGIPYGEAVAGLFRRMCRNKLQRIGTRLVRIHLYPDNFGVR